MANYQNLTGSRYFEDRGLAIGSETGIYFQPLPIRAKGNISVNLSFSHNTDIPVDTFHAWQLDAWMFPLTGVDHASVRYQSMQNVKDMLYDVLVPKTDPTDLSGLGSPIRQGEAGLEAQLEQGDADNNLVWQPGRINTAAFFTPATEVMRVHHQRFRAGWPLGGDTAFRTADGLCNTRVNTSFNVGFGPLPTEHVFLIMLVNPADFDVKNWDDLNPYILPRENDWDNYKWMTPEMNKITGQESIHPATEDDFWRFADIHYTNGTNRQWVQRTLDYYGDIDVHIDRAIVASNFEATPADPVPDSG